MTRVGNPVLSAVRRSLGRRPGDGIAPVPAALPRRTPGAPEAELELLFQELRALSGVAQRVGRGQVAAELERLAQTEKIRRAALWDTERFERLDLRAHLEHLGVSVVGEKADKHELGRCDLGITEVDVALPETGTLGLFSSSSRPRAVSLLPRVHLAILTPSALVRDLHDVFERARHEHYLVLVTGPSRTADIELTVTLGVHGPQRLVVWCVED